MQLKSTKAMFADDTTLVHAGNNLNKTAHELKNDLEVIMEWLKQNRLLLNVKKSNALIFRWKYCNKGRICYLGFYPKRVKVKENV